MREIVHLQAGQCGNQIGAKVLFSFISFFSVWFCIRVSLLQVSTLRQRRLIHPARILSNKPNAMSSLELRAMNENGHNRYKFARRYSLQDLFWAQHSKAFGQHLISAFVQQMFRRHAL